MTEQLDPKQQLTDIQNCIAEAKEDLSGGMSVAVVMGALTIAVLVGMIGFGIRGSLLWPIHHVVGWTYVLIWFSRGSQKEGRVSRRGVLALRMWAVVTLGLWMSWLATSKAPFVLNYLVPLWLALGIFVMGLLFEDSFSQWLAVFWMLVVGSCSLLASSFLANILLVGSLAAVMPIWAGGQYVMRVRHGV